MKATEIVSKDDCIKYLIERLNEAGLRHIEDPKNDKKIFELYVKADKKNKNHS
jgi:vacuolar-type H+-ATPase subunit I/STV1